MVSTSCHGGGAVSNVQLAKDPMQVSLDGPFGNVKLACQFLVAEPEAHFPNNLNLRVEA